jgi:hypothetical protein
MRCGVRSAEPKERDGLWRNRLHPTGAADGVDVWWHVTNERSAEAVVLDMVRQVERTGLPMVLGLLDRSELMASVRRGDLGFFKGEANRAFFDCALAVLLADTGPSLELDDLLRRLEIDPGAAEASRLGS